MILTTMDGGYRPLPDIEFRESGIRVWRLTDAQIDQIKRRRQMLADLKAWDARRSQFQGAESYVR